MSSTTETPPKPGATAGQVAAGATIAVAPVVSPADARSGLTKALRALTRCLPPDTPDRAALLQAVQAALDRLGPAPEHRVCARCGAPFIFSIERQGAYADRRWVAPRHCKRCREVKHREHHGGQDGRPD